MCGIAGIVRFTQSPVERERLERMLAHMQHRGPDGHGISLHPPIPGSVPGSVTSQASYADAHSSPARCGLAHARLSVIDLLSGQQPMHIARRDSAGPLHLVFNGEIYNHRELRKKLEMRGHHFASSHSDTEVLLYGYRQWGSMLPKHLHGMFAFAIYDQNEQSLFLARDRAGKKPLYIMRREDELIFAGLIGTITAGLPKGVSPRINRDSLLDYLHLGYTFQRSIVDGVEEIPAAHWALVKPDGSMQCERYWRPPPISKHSTSLGAVDAVHEVITEGVVKRLESDVPLGCFLSGGLDSSVIAAIAQQHRNQHGGDALATFSVAMPDLRYDESSYAQTVADHIGAQHTVLQTHPGDAINDLTLLMNVTGEPLGDSSLLPTYWLCRAARQHVTVAMSGDGGDELFGGYDRYRAIRLIEKHRWWMHWLPSRLFANTDMTARSARIRRLLEAAKAGGTADQWYQSMIQLFTFEQLSEMGLGDELNRCVTDQADCTSVLGTDWPQQRDQVHAAMRWDLEHYLPFDLLRKLDRASMTVALEVRCPLLDTQVCDLAGHLPDKVLMPGGVSKGLLKQFAKELLPEAIVHRRKRGFAVPMDRWFRKELRGQLADHLFDDRLEQLGINIQPVQRMYQEHMDHKFDHTHRLFTLLQLAIFARWLEAPQTPPVFKP